MTTVSGERSAPLSRSGWIHGPATDLAMALCWVPFAVAALIIDDTPSQLRTFVAAVFLLSFSHQPLTLALVYGDKAQFGLRRRIFTWSPLVFIAALIVAQQLSFVVLAVVAGLWNAEHTLMQRYGIARIYGRKAGQHDGGGLEKALLFSWLALAMVWAAADEATTARVTQIGLGGANKRGVEVLTDLRPAAQVILPAAIAVAGAMLVAWLVAETRRGEAASWSKRFYLASTAGLFVTILVNPVAGFLAYVGSHAVEYFIIVHQNLGTRYASAQLDGGAPVGHAVRTPVGRPGFFVVYLGLIVGIVTLVERYGSALTYTLVFFTLGGLHVFYDGFIWKLRRPALATSFDLAPTTGDAQVAAHG